MRRARHNAFWWSLALMIGALSPVVGANADDDFAVPPQAERAAVSALIGHGARVQIDADYRVHSVVLGGACTNDDVQLLAALERLDTLQLSSVTITDDGLGRLKGLTSLKRITITASGLTDVEIEALRAALPACQIAALGRGARGGFADPGGSGGRGGRSGGGGPAGGGFNVRTNSVSGMARIGAVQDDLKLTPEQRQKIAAATDPLASRSALDAKVLALLMPEQQARLKQIELQQAGAAALLRDEVAGALALSADQRAAVRRIWDEATANSRKVAAELRAGQTSGGFTAELFSKMQEKSRELNKQRDDMVLAVLTDEQRQAWTGMLGAEGPKAAPNGGFGGRNSGASNLARSGAIQDELQMTPEQRQQIAAATDPMALQIAIDASVSELLTPEQQARLKQIELQQAGTAALLRDEVAKALTLSAEQQAALRELSNDAVAKLRAATSDLRAQNPNGAAELFAKTRQLSAELNKVRDDKIVAVLTEDQRKAWQEMLGPVGPNVGAFTNRGGFVDSAPRASAASIFDRYDADRDGMLTDAEFPATDRIRQFMARAVTLQLPLSRADFERLYAESSAASRSRE